MNCTSFSRMQDSHEEQSGLSPGGEPGKGKGFKRDGLGTLVIWPTVSSFRIGVEKKEDREEKEREGERT